MIKMDFSTNNQGDILPVFTGKQPSSTHVVCDSTTGKQPWMEILLAILCFYFYFISFYSLVFGIGKQPGF